MPNLREVTAETLTEAAVSSQGDTLLRIIGPGWSINGRYYPPEVLERDGPTVFAAGTHTYIDHPTRTEESDRPERSIRDLAGALTENARWLPDGPAGPGLYARARIREGYQPLVDELADVIGVSIRGDGEVEHGQAEGRTGPVVRRLLSAESVDYVTRPSAGGRVVQLIESVQTIDEAAHGLSANELRELLEQATPDRSFVVDFGESWVIYERFGESVPSGLFRVGYTISDGTVDLGSNPVEVRRRVDYVPVSAAVAESSRLVEARNAGQWFESRIHLDFTVVADQLAADGHLTRDERIALSSAIGDALEAFNASVAANVPHLYDRDPYGEPGSMTVSESTTEQQEAPMPITEQEAQSLREAAETAARERDEARAELDRVRDVQRVTEARSAVTDAVGAVEIPGAYETVAESIRTRAAAQIQVVRDDQGAIVGDALAEAARRAVNAEVEALTTLAEAAGVGRPAGLGGGGQPVDVTDEQLAQGFQRLGLSESEAQTAAAGR